MINEKIKTFREKLEKEGVAFEIREHPAIKTVEEGLEYLGITGADGVSTLIFKTDTDYAAVFRRDDHQLDFEKIKKILGTSTLRMASEEELLKLTGSPKGATPVLSGLRTIMDETLLERQFVFGGTGSFEHDVKIDPKDLQRITKAREADVISDKKKRILTGDTPSGKLHIGHFVGTLENRVKLQNTYETYILLANVHAYANNYADSDTINRNVYDVFLDNLAVGIDPNVSTIYLESGIPETFELYSFFLTMVKHSRALRNPSVKEEIKYKKLDPSVGFIVYPILQAADILGFNADLVPVGEDQLPVIEQTREIARDFNQAFGETFIVPEARVGRVARLIGTDGKLKMSKSGGNAILLSDSEETLRQKVKSLYTDPARVHATDPGKVEGNVAFMYHDAFNPNKAEVEDLKERYKAGKVGDVEVKEKLFVALNNFLAPIREKRRYFEDRPEEAREILIEGTKRARKAVVEVVERVKERVGLNKLINS